ncbi:hypothetical protein GIB67_026357 [Kingdonia uniflora]|uniref:non-specific serine/threonine protein kinase n=1 Tax=Kingdonia uniflora TaxID=39325 RepID=A0A7J7P5Z3_9MAGN|nr:hypothetical protein GIB67_026357 [Kingdonia uniflora]
MPRMKQLLRKLHIGGNTSANAIESSPSIPSTTATFDRATMTDSSESPIRGGDHTDNSADYSFFEEEFQVQLALAISASDSDSKVDPESAQIKAAKELSLVWSPSGAVDYLSLRYWNNNVIDYSEKVMDGFYDVYGITSNSSMHGKMPLLMDLQATAALLNVDYEVILVNSTVDPILRKLERRAEYLAVECRATELGMIRSGLVQKIADLVSDSMGGPVGNADEMLRRWTIRSNELRRSLNTVVLPLGCLNLGLSRHRALLFKVLADWISLPCRLVKGSYYTGTDGGAVNFIKIDRDSEYIVDLMGAPGALIPAEIPSDHLQNFGLDGTNSLIIEQTIKDSSSALDMINNALNLNLTLKESGSGSQASNEGFPMQGNNVYLSEKNQTEKFEDDFDKLLPSLCRSHAGSSGTSGKASPAQKMQVKDVSKCVISAAQNPDFAQKLHAVLLESCASVPLWDPGEQKVLDQNWFEDRTNVAASTSINFDISSSSSRDKPGSGSSASPLERNTNNVFEQADSWHRLLPIPWNGVEQYSQDEEIIAKNSETEGIFHAQEFHGRTETSMVNVVRAYSHDPHISNYSDNERINPLLDEVVEWEIPWEDIQIGERVGIGSYGEVYHADWNGTEVAVKKFLDQEFSGDALEQLRCEVSIMQRMRHPNVVLFMGAVTRPPNLSILTEFLPRGSLRKLLHRPNIQLDERRRLRMALDVAKGMNYLHTSNPTIVHRDLKSPNLLVDKNWNVKVCDFGLSRLKHHTFLSSNSMGGTAEWMAPEVLRNEPSNEKCDVFSFGVILWELATMRVPWSGMMSMQVVGAVGFQNRRLEIPEDVDPKIAKIIRDCWQSDPSLRPSFSQLMFILKCLQHLNVQKT